MECKAAPAGACNTMMTKVAEKKLTKSSAYTVASCDATGHIGNVGKVQRCGVLTCVQFLPAIFWVWLRHG
jgi:hypothetical protein